MSTNAFVRVRIDETLKKEAAIVLSEMGLTDQTQCALC